MKKYVWLVISLALTSLWFLPETIIRPLMHLLILGIIPGTNTEMGFIFPFSAILIGTFLLIRWLSQTSEALVDFKTKSSHAERRAAELRSAAKKRSAIVEIPSVEPVMDAEEIELQSI